MDFKKLINEVVVTTALAVAANGLAQLTGRVTNTHVRMVHKCDIDTPLVLCQDSKCFYHAIDKRRAMRAHGVRF